MGKKVSITLKKTSAVMVFDGAAIAGASLIVSILKNRYGLEYDFTGLLLAVLSAGNLLSGLLFGLLPGFIGTWATALLLCSGLFIGYLILALFSAPALLAAGFFIIGLGKGTTINHCMVIMGNNMPDRTRAVNLVNALFALGSLLCPFVFIIVGRLDWELAPAAVMSFFGFIILLLFFTVRMDGKDGAKPAPDDLSFLRDLHFWLSTLLLFFDQCTEISVTSWLVTYFKDTGILSGTLGELTVTVLWLAMLSGRLIIIYVLPASSRLISLSLMSAGAFIMYLGLVMSDNGVMAIIFLFLFAFCMSGVYPTVIAQAGRSLNNASVGTMLPLGGLGAIIMPYITGFAAQRIGLRGGMLCTLTAIAGMFIISRLLRRCRT